MNKEEREVFEYCANTKIIYKYPDEWRNGRFIYSHDFNYWICTSCGYKIEDKIMQWLPKAPPCPNCDTAQYCALLEDEKRPMMR